MKFIHTADWHIGKLVNEFSMIDDQRYILDRLTEILIDENADALVIAGDVYDRSIPPTDAVELLNGFLNKAINELGIKVLIIAGNHDGGERLSFGNSLFNDKGLYIEGVMSNDIKNVKLEDDFGFINFHLVPYAHPAEVRKLYEDDSIKDHNDANKAIVDRIISTSSKDERQVLVTHGYVTGESVELEISDSERPLSIGGTDYVDCKIYDYFDYVALGHLHGRQRVGSDKVRYSGSLLKYSFSEINHKNGVNIVSIDGEGNIETSYRELKAKRNLRTIRGPLEELIKAGYEDIDKEDYIQAILTDEGELIEPIQKLRAVYPNVMLLKRESTLKEEITNNLLANEYENKSKIDIFKDYFEAVSGLEFGDDKKEILSEIISSVIKEEEPK